MLHTPSVSTQMHWSHMILQPCHTQTQRGVYCWFMLSGNVCLYSLFPCQHLHHSYYYCSLLIGHLPFRFHCSPGNKPLSLSLSVSFLPFLTNRRCSYCCNCSYQHYSQVLPPSSPSQPSLPLYLIFHALHVLSWELSSSCCLPAFYIVCLCLSSHSLFPP